ncbi:MAG: calcium-binding protein [Hyphomicrobiales bacterium]|nr:calcium-binding protein [Hyphomicrobiales bacterium]
MAYFETQVKTNTTGGKNQPFPDGDIVTSDDDMITVPTGDRYVDYLGEFFYSGGLEPTGGTVVSIDAVADISKPTEIRGPTLASWSADGGTYSIVTLFEAETNAVFYGHLFKGDDWIIGSRFNDKLAGYKGDDSIWGMKGKDKLFGDQGKDELDGGKGKDKSWGGAGKDWFRFNEDYSVDRVKDFSRKKDTLVIDRDIAKNFKQVKKVASEKKGDVVLNFGDGDKFIIEDLKLSKLNKVKFEFFDFDS